MRFSAVLDFPQCIQHMRLVLPLRVGNMQQINVYIVRLQPFKAFIQRANQVIARKVLAAFLHTVVRTAFGNDDGLFALPKEEFSNQRFAVAIAVAVSCVKEVDALLPSLLQCSHGIFVGDVISPCLSTDSPRTKANFGNTQASFTQFSIFHIVTLPFKKCAIHSAVRQRPSCGSSEIF